ncbi:DUF418 domain-containing protein [Actinokineospora auranticolor]|uniref:DUF418 domain-containing protein n=1 Tax=Actinokineospora auranticolor TaxID=155976 RepID=A0A2S6GPD7_9PSEU|nr:DUF418 domain-containing protein [Actinokineospora auranticolor]PPK67056.1 uncharacterized protein CLV40_10853 [Actinokineospora auranticolor]
MGEKRLTALDVLRGVAILGTFGTNVWIFSSPAGISGIFGAAGPVETALRVLSNGKFLALLSILFGVGLAIQHASALRRGARWPGRYLWRATLLLVEGALHYLLVFEFDVLMFYAVISVQVAYLVGRSDRVQRWWMAAAATLHLVVVGGITALLLADGGSLSGGTPPDTSDWTAQVATRVEKFLVYRAEAVFVLPLGVVLFLAGSRLYRAGALADTPRGAVLRRRLAAWGLGAGLPLSALTAWAGPQWALVERYACAPVVAFGLLGAVTALVRRMRAAAGPLRRGVTAVGRCALSCYIAQNVLGSVLCYDWGLGRTGGPLWTVACWLLVSAAVVAGASWWMTRHDRGPVETLWDMAYRAPGFSRAASGSAAPRTPRGSTR